MSVTKEDALEALTKIPDQCRGVGGAVAIVSEGQVIARRVWGYADAERGIPMTASTLLPICSISKQFFCGLLVRLETLPEAEGGFGPGLHDKMAASLGDFLPAHLLEGRDRLQMIEQMCDNHSGIRDYWALTAAWGASPEGVFSIPKHGPEMRKRVGGYHFSPGTEYSYCNTNFHVLGRLLEAVTGQDLPSLLKKHMFDPAGMKTAQLCPDNANLPPPCMPYDGDELKGWVPAVNRIEWSGDAGIVASLDDMAAYESFLDRSLDDKSGTPNWYKLALDEKAWLFDDEAKTPARYRRGLGKGTLGNLTVYGHGGALRGFRLGRHHVPEKHLSVVVLLNHMTDNGQISSAILRHLFKIPAPATGNTAFAPSASWAGTYLDEETKLHITVTSDEKAGNVLVKYGLSAWTLPLTAPDTAATELGDVKASLSRPDGLRVQIQLDNRVLSARRLAKPVASASTKPFRGVFKCDEVDSVFNCRAEGTDADSDTAWLYGSFDGFLGKGQALPMRPIGEDVWIVTCPRGMDVPAPGDWTAVFSRGADGSVSGVTIGCWLARKLVYVKTA